MSAGTLPRDEDVENFEDVFREWLRRDQARNRSFRSVENALRNHALPRLKGKRIDAIRRKDILRILDGLVDAGAPIQANRVLAYLRRLFNWALERDLVTANPVAGMKPPSRERAADRVLSQDELRAVWHGADKLGYAFGPFIQLLILTGQRRDEVASMTWSEVDLDAGLWTIPGQRTKNGRPHLVHLSEPATEIGEDVNPWEVGLDRFINFEKGCYTGQEVILRLYNYSKIQRRIAGLSFPSPNVSEGAVLSMDGEDVGRVTTVITHPVTGAALGLGFVRVANLKEGARLELVSAQKETVSEAILHELQVMTPVGLSG